MSAYTTYWSNETADAEISRGGEIVHAASAAFTRAKPGDRIFVVTIRKGRLALLGAMTVESVLPHPEAVNYWHQLGNEEPLYEASHHVFAKAGTATPIRELDIHDVVPRMRFLSKRNPALILSDGLVDQQSMRSLRELDDPTAVLLEALLRGDQPKDPDTTPSDPVSEYRPAKSQPSMRDAPIVAVYGPELNDRANLAHQRTQELFAGFLRANGFEPSSPDRGAPDFDISWKSNGLLCVGEVKSITEDNATDQLRYGIGQLLHYASQLEEGGSTVGGLVLVLEREPPRSKTWTRTCSAAGIQLMWAPRFAEISFS